MKAEEEAGEGRVLADPALADQELVVMAEDRECGDRTGDPRARNSPLGDLRFSDTDHRQSTFCGWLA